MDDVLTYANETWRFPEGIMEGLNPIVSTFTRDLPYGWSQLVENLIDPAHVPFAHHGMQGKRTDAIPINMTIPEEKGDEGFSFQWEDRTMGLMRKGKGGFRAPYSVWYDANFETDPPRKFELTVLCIPTKPGWSRAIIATTSKAEEKSSASSPGKKKPKSLMGTIFKMLPPWIIHILSNRFLDSDLAFLHYQEREIARQGRPNYFMPAPADRCIGALRKGISAYTSIASDPLPPAMTRVELFDRYAQHSSHCKECQMGLKSLQTWRRWVYIALAASVLGIELRVAKATFLLSLGLLRVFQKLENQLKVGEFKHYENH
jgi:pheophorbide a oxygenase